jgi:alpha-mannosidase/mannosylglycerate hydrolase
LRLFAPTGFASAKQFWADTPFDAVARPIEMRHDNHLLRELQVEMTPQQNWIATSDGSNGLALLAPGQYESAVLDQPDRPLCLTLLRAFRKAVFTDGNEGGQIQGSHTIKLGVTPFQATPDAPVPATHLFQTAQSLAAPAHALYIDNRDLLDRPVRARATARFATPFPRVEGEVVLSAWQQFEPGQWSLRVYNPALIPADVKLVGGSNWRRADFHNDAKGAVSGSITLKPKEVATLLCEAQNRPGAKDAMGPSGSV